MGGGEKGAGGLNGSRTAVSCHQVCRRVVGWNEVDMVIMGWADLVGLTVHYSGWRWALIGVVERSGMLEPCVS